MKVETGKVNVPRLEMSQDTADRKAGIAELVGLEILESRFEPGAWATALAESDGKKQEALAIYARIRIEQLNARSKRLTEKRDRLEARRLVHCLGREAGKLKAIRTVQDLLRGPQSAVKANLPKPKLSVLWLFVLMLGSASFVGTAGRLLAPSLPHNMVHSLSWIAAMSALLSLGVALALWIMLPKSWIRSGWNLGLLTLCNIACLASLLIGTKLIKRAITRDEQIVLSPNAGQSTGANNRPLIEMRVERPKSRLIASQAP
jgi:hypothetical protein